MRSADTVTFEAIGTTWDIHFENPLQPADSTAHKKNILQICEDFDAAYSRFRPDSLVTKLFKSGGPVTFPDSLKQLMPLYTQLYEVTKGAFTPCVGETLSNLGYDAEYSLQQKKSTSPGAKLDSVIVAGTNISSTEPVLLDFGAAGKGLLIDLITAYLTAAKLGPFTVNGSGDLFHCGSHKLQIGLEHPTQKNTVLGTTELTADAAGKACCSSASNRRAWDQHHHIVNGTTGQSTDGILASWVVADTAMVADALATCLFLCTPDVLQRHFDFAYCVVFDDYSYSKSDNFSGTIFTNSYERDRMIV